MSESQPLQRRLVRRTIALKVPCQVFENMCKVRGVTLEQAEPSVLRREDGYVIFDSMSHYAPAKVIATLKEQPPGLGDMVAAGLSAVGITKERVTKLMGKDCGCAERQKKLNELGQQAAAAVRKLTGQEPPADGKKLDDQTH